MAVMNSDLPLTNPSEDRFNRKEFSERLTEIIKSKYDHNSLVIGIYGEWGNGKTTVLNFIEHNLKSDPSAICIRFNPWRYRDEDTLMLMFFTTISSKLSTSKIKELKEIGGLINNIPGVYLPIQLLGLAHGVPIEANTVRDFIGKITETNVDIDKNRADIDKLLVKSGKRLVVLIDDIDRLDRAEIQYLFKLVKQTANFHNTTYVLAFDEGMVASALGEKYGPGGNDLDKNLKAGRSFLEKIVQIPVNLPLIEQDVLIEYGYELIYKSLKSADIRLSEGDKKTFERDFKYGFASRAINARVVKRYENALLLSLPLLKDKVNTNDLLLIEGVRIFYPLLYELAREDRELFLDTGLRRWGEGMSPNRPDEIGDLLTKNYPDEIDDAMYVLRTLFPRLGTYIEYSTNQEYRWNKDKKIASKEHFDTYFLYTNPLAGHNLYDVEAFIATIEGKLAEKGIENTIPDIVSEIKRINRDQDLSEFVSTLRVNSDRLSPNAKVSFSIAISMVGYLFDDPLNIEVLTTTAQSAAILVIKIISQLHNPEMRLQTLRKVIQDGQRLEFVYLCYGFAVKDELNFNPTPFTMAEKKELGKAMLDKIKGYWSPFNPLYLSSKRYATALFHIWAEYGDAGDASKQLIESFNKAPGNVVDFVRCIPVREGDVNTKTIIDADFTENEYVTLRKIIDPREVYNAITKNYGEDLEVLTYAKDMPEQDKRAVRQFVSIYIQKQNGVDHN